MGLFLGRSSLRGAAPTVSIVSVYTEALQHHRCIVLSVDSPKANFKGGSHCAGVILLGPIILSLRPESFISAAQRPSLD